MAHYVICSICGKKFNRDVVQTVRTGARRYAHLECDPNNTDLIPLEQKEDSDLIKLKNFINELYGKEANWALINKQIKTFTLENNYSYSGILKSLIYFYQIQGNSIDKANGSIGIVPFVYNAAYNYYYNLFITQSLNENKDITKITSKVKEVFINPPQITLPKKFFNLDDEEVDNE